MIKSHIQLINKLSKKKRKKRKEPCVWDCSDAIQICNEAFDQRHVWILCCKNCTLILTLFFWLLSWEKRKWKWKWRELGIIYSLVKGKRNELFLFVCRRNGEDWTKEGFAISACVRSYALWTGSFLRPDSSSSWAFIFFQLF